MREMLYYVLSLFLLFTDLTSSLLGCARFRSEIEVFPVQCQGTVIGNFCDGKLVLPLNRIKFKAFPERQEVVRDHGDGNLGKLKDCVVKDWKNWRCSSFGPTESFVQTMADGEYRVTIVPMSTPWDIVYVSAWTWWKMHLGWR